MYNTPTTYNAVGRLMYLQYVETDELRMIDIIT